MVKNKEYQVWEATATGKSHRKVNNPCQDSVKTQEVDLGKGVKAIIAALSDGAGSARKSVAGSKISVKTFIKEMEREIRYFSHYIESDNDKENENNQLFKILKEKLENKKLIKNIFLRCRKELVMRSQEEKNNLKNYHATLIGSVILLDNSGKTFLSIGSVGDSASIVLEDIKENNMVFSCSSITEITKGEYANQTVFLTSESWEEAFAFNTSNNIRGLFLTSDGLDKLYFQTKFVEENEEASKIKRFKWEIVPDEDYLNLLVQKIVSEDKSSEFLSEHFLSHKELQEVNDDDKSLILFYKKRGDDYEEDEKGTDTQKSPRNEAV